MLATLSNRENGCTALVVLALLAGSWLVVSPRTQHCCFIAARAFVFETFVIPSGIFHSRINLKRKGVSM